jgi:hypothetical protein
MYYKIHGSGNQGCGSVFIWYGSGSGSRGFDDKNWTNLQLKKKKLKSKTTIYLYLGLHKGRPSYKRSLQLSKKNIQHFNMKFLKFFLLLWVIFALLDPDPDSEYGSGSTGPIESGSN